MDRFVARRNVEHFQRLLDQEVDPGERARIEGLLREAHEQLGTAEEAHRVNPPKSTG